MNKKELHKKAGEDGERYPHNNPKVSIIVPVYNVEKYLRRCVDSILEQSFADYEIILVDDGSTDDCGRICDGYTQSDKRIIVIHQKNKGLAAARNAGLNISSGNYISFIDSDDYIHPDMINVLYQRITEEDADIVVCGYQSVNEKGVALDNNALGVDTDLVLSNYEGLRWLCGSVNRNSAWNKLYKRECFSNIRFPEGKICEDAFIMHELFYFSSRTAVTPVQLYYYFRRNDSIMLGKITVRRLDEVEAYYRRTKFVESYGLSNRHFPDFANRMIDSYLRVRNAIPQPNDEEKERLHETKWMVLYCWAKHSNHKDILNIISIAFPRTFRLLRKTKRICTGRPFS